MKGRLIDFAVGYNRKPRVTIELDSDFRNSYDKLKDFDVEISIKKWRQHRRVPGLREAEAVLHLGRHIQDQEREIGGETPSVSRLA